mmetsp:Transcript_92857/g.268140  ORF Transcript_92857/g.268140 Transcript_92857/m.268140 type:complete len:307 (-) Transcript_92857:638-1558(-)
MVAHDAHGPDRWQQDRESLADLVVVARAAQLLKVDVIGRPQALGARLRHLADDADAQAGAREGVAHHGVVRQAELPAQGAHLILEEQPKRLDHLHLHAVGKATHVVVRLDDTGRPLERGGLDDVGVERALQEQALIHGQLHLCHRLLEALDEESADDLSLVLRLRDALELCVELLPRVEDLQAHAWDVGLEPLLDDDGLVLAQEACVDHKGLEPLADGLVDERGGDTRVDATADSADDILAVEVGHDELDLLLREVVHVPLALATADLEHEVLDHLRAVGRVRHLRVVLQAIQVTSRILHRCELGV